jgi:hypothetical protein
MASQPPLPNPAVRKCYKCEHENPITQAFCGACGSHTDLNDYISHKVKAEVHHSIQDRDVLETDSSIKVFDKAWKWMRLIIATAVTVVVVSGGSVLWRAWGLWRSVDDAEKSISTTTKTSTEQIATVASTSKQVIDQAADSAKTNITKASSEASAAAVKSTKQVSQDAAASHSDMEGSRQQLQDASKLKPEIEALRKQVADATKDIQDQKGKISSSESFVKSVFSTHGNEYFFLNTALQGAPPDRYAVVTPVNAQGANFIYLLLNQTPVPGTMQLEYHVFVQPPNTYFQVAHNLFLFIWPEPVTNLVGKQLTVSYFGDSSDKDLIKSLTYHDGRWFADDQPLPNLGHPDPDFKGNKWTPAPQVPAAPKP